MKHEINKERLWIFAPVATITTKVTIDGKASVEQIKEAIREAVNSNAVLKTKVVLEGEKAYLVPQESVCYQVEETKEAWRKILHDQEKIPFDLSRGEYIRFFLIHTGDVHTEQVHTERVHEENENDLVSIKEAAWTLLLLGHHLAGDGSSYAFLIQDILRALNHEELTEKTIQLFDMEDLPSNSGLNGPMKWMLNSMNRQWGKSGKQFTFEEFTTMAQRYWEKHSSYIEIYKLTGTSYQTLLKTAKENNITVNSLITTAFIKAAEACGEKQTPDVGIAVSIRKEGYQGMGNFATGISIQRKYANKKSFLKNCIEVQKQIYTKLKDEKKKFFLLQFMGKITGSLVDAIYFSAVDGYENKTAKTFSKMFGYDGNAKGISITNLTKLPIKSNYGGYQLKDYLFIPPLVLHGKRIIGVASLGDSMEISFIVEDNKEKEQQLHYFHTAMKILEGMW